MITFRRPRPTASFGVILAGTAWLVIALGAIGFVVVTVWLPWFWPIDLLVLLFGIVAPARIVGSMWGDESPRGALLAAAYAGLVAAMVWRGFGMSWALPLMLTAILTIVAAIHLRR